jgi:4-aminobutyrate aminotransferase-like enzyme
MRIRIAVLADYASISLGDKLNVLGIFSNIFARAEPVVHPQMQLVLQFEFDASEAGKKNARIILQDDDGRELLSMNGEIAVPRAPHGEPIVVNQILLLNNTNFPQFGHYEFAVLLNGRLEATLPLTVRKAEEAKLVA